MAVSKPHSVQAGHIHHRVSNRLDLHASCLNLGRAHQHQCLLRARRMELRRIVARVSDNSANQTSPFHPIVDPSQEHITT